MVSMDSRTRVDRAATLKSELVAYAFGAEFKPQLGVAVSAAFEHTDDDQDALVYAVESILFERAEQGGATVLENYLANETHLAPKDRELLESWRDRAVFGVFQVVRRKGDTLTLMNLVDDLSYTTYSTMGAAALRPATPGRYVLTRVVPIGNDWVLSGIQSLYPKTDRLIVGAIVARLIQNDPTGPYRNPEKRLRSLEIVGQYHKVFLSLFGADAVAGTGQDVAAQYRRYLRDCAALALVASPGATNPAEIEAVAERAYQTFPAELFDAEDVAMLHHPVKGASFYREHGRVEAAHRRPPARARAEGVIAVRDYLADESIPAFVLSRLASAYPDTVDRLYRLVLKRPAFRWATDGDALLRERKPLWFATADLPDLTLMPQIVVDAMAHATIP